MRYLRTTVAMIVIVFFTALITAVANSAPSPTDDTPMGPRLQGEFRVGEVVGAQFVCKDLSFLKAILSLEDDATITAAANASLADALCGWSNIPFEVTLLEYMGFVDMKLEPPGRAYIYRVEDPDGNSHYMYMWVERRPV